MDESQGSTFWEDHWEEACKVADAAQAEFNGVQSSPPSQNVAAMEINAQVSGGTSLETRGVPIEEPIVAVPPPMLHRGNGPASPGARRTMSQHLRQERVPASPHRPSPARPSPARPSPCSTPPGSTLPASPPPLPFPLRFALHAAGVPDIEAIDLDARRILSDAFSKDGWPGILSVTKHGDRLVVVVSHLGFVTLRRFDHVGALFSGTFYF